MNTEPQLKIAFEIPKTDRNDFVADLPASAVIAEKEAEPPANGGLGPANFISPVEIVVVVTAVWLVKRLTDEYFRTQAKGTLIDLRLTPPKISVVGDVPAGFVLIVSPDGGTEIVRQEDDKSLEEMMAAAFGALSGR